MVPPLPVVPVCDTMLRVLSSRANPGTCEWCDGRLDALERVLSDPSGMALMTPGSDGAEGGGEGRTMDKDEGEPA